MRRTLITLSIALAAIIAQAQRQAFIANTTDFGQLKNIIGEKTEEIDSLVVEGPINAEDFSAIWECAFYGKLEALNLEKAEIEGGIIPDEALFNREAQEIDPLTFYTTGLREVILPEGVTEIGKGAFRCSQIERINLPSTLRKLGTSCFYLCDYLNPCPLIIPEGVKEIPADCFRCCHSLTEVVLPNSLTVIRNAAFYDSRPMYCNFPKNLKAIGQFAFAEVHGLKSVHLPNGCVNLGESVFDGCVNIEEFTFPDDIGSIPMACLDYTPALKQVIIPPSVINIGAHAFCQSGISSIIVPEGVERIGAQAFAFTNLDSIVLPSTLRFIDGQACRCENVGKIISYAKTPAECGIFFDEGPFRYSTPTPLYVPQGTADLYRNAQGWNVLTNVIEMTPGQPTAIRPASLLATPTATYNLRGQRINGTPSEGVYIKNGKRIITIRR